MSAPHVIPYQGSKRKLAPQIIDYVQHEVKGAVYEPFAGSAAITLAAAASEIGTSYVIGDKFSPLIDLWDLIINKPEYVADNYSKIWNAQLDDPESYFLEIRRQFNDVQDPVQFLYLVARCVKNAIRFNANGEFNQSADNRRLGMKPEKVSKESYAISSILKGKTSAIAGDFMEVLKNAGPDDLVYMDPPWQGTSLKKDPRYAYLLDLDELVNGLAELNERGVPYLLSFDGTCGDKSYGKELPEFLQLEKVGLNAGRSSQAILLGRDDVTIESLYISPAMIEKNREKPRIVNRLNCVLNRKIF
jgi:DNA adenine methylase